MTQPTPPTTDWNDWYRRWEAQQSSYMPVREDRFTVIVEAVRAIGGDAPHVVDLGCGPGSLGRRIVDAIPGAQVTGVDMDPVLLAIGRQVHADRGDRLRFVDADLRDAWEEELGHPVDVAVSTTALHWLPMADLRSLYDRLGRLIRSEGAFLDGDSIAFPQHEPAIAAAARAMRPAISPRASDGTDAEDWDTWWAAVEREPALASEVAERARRQHQHPDHDHEADISVHVEALRAAGFVEVDTLWQRLSDRVLLAIR